MSSFSGTQIFPPQLHLSIHVLSLLCFVAKFQSLIMAENIGQRKRLYLKLYNESEEAVELILRYHHYSLLYALSPCYSLSLYIKKVLDFQSKTLLEFLERAYQRDGQSVLIQSSVPMVKRVYTRVRKP